MSIRVGNDDAYLDGVLATDGLEGVGTADEQLARGHGCQDTDVVLTVVLQHRAHRRVSIFL